MWGKKGVICASSLSNFLDVQIAQRSKYMYKLKQLGLAYSQVKPNDFSRTFPGIRRIADQGTALPLQTPSINFK